MKQNVWLSVIAAVLAIGTLVGVLGMLSKVSGGGTGSTEKEGAILTNDSDKVEWIVKGSSFGVQCTDNSILKANKKYRLILYFNESEHQDFLKKYGLYFSYALCTDEGSAVTKIPAFEMNMVASGSSYDFSTSGSPRFLLYFVKGSEQSANEKTILAYLKEKMRFGVYELPDDTVIQKSVYSYFGANDSGWAWQEPSAAGQYSYARLNLGIFPMQKGGSSYRIVFRFNQAALEEAVKKFGMEFRYGYTFSTSTSDPDGGVSIASLNTKGVNGFACFDFTLPESIDVFGIYFLRSSLKNNDPTFENIDRDAVLAFLKENIHYSVWKIG